MVQDPKRPVQDIAGVSGGGLEDDRDRISTGEPVVREVADERGRRRRAKDIELNDNDVAPPDDPTRTLTGDQD